jgi:ribosomal protein S18 acetylase RimI-like enzyme
MMSLLGTDREMTKVRSLRSTDVPDLLRLIENAWRIHLRISPVELRSKIGQVPGFLAEDRVGLRGFMMLEPYPPGSALIIAAGLRDTWSVIPYLDRLLPPCEHAARNLGASGLVHVGSFAWLVEGLVEHGFETREWIVIYERQGQAPSPGPTRTTASIRTAHQNDLPGIAALDGLAFEHIWHMTVGNLREALARAVSFAVAIIDGKVVAYEWCEMVNQHAHLTRLAVHPAYQGQGIGAQLLHRAVSDALYHGANLITLNTQEHNQRSRLLYQRFGFTNTGERLPILWKPLE